MDSRTAARRRKRNIQRVITIVIFDIVLAGIGLLIFALFHHVLPQKGGAGVALQSPITSTQKADATLSLSSSLSDDKTQLSAEIFVASEKAISAGTFTLSFDAQTLEYVSCTGENGVTYTAEKSTISFTAEKPTNKLCTVVFKILNPISSSSSPLTLKAVENGFFASDGSVAAVTIKNDLENQKAEATGDFADKFPDKFTTGEVIKADNKYISKNVNVSLEKVQKDEDGKKITYFVADIYVRSVDFFKTGLAGNTYGKGYAQGIEEFSAQSNALIAINGDYYGARSVGVVVRNGIFYRNSLFDDVLVMWQDGTMATFEASAFNFDNVQAQHGGIWQAWSFGPELLHDGQTMTSFNSKVNPANPRTAIGYYEPGHYCFVVVDGRQDGYSDGYTTKEMSQLMASLGCTVAYNLDGGQSSLMTWNGALANIPYNGGRKTSDFVYIPME